MFDGPCCNALARTSVALDGARLHWVTSCVWVDQANLAALICFFRFICRRVFFETVSLPRMKYAQGVLLEKCSGILNEEMVPSVQTSFLLKHLSLKETGSHQGLSKPSQASKRRKLQRTGFNLNNADTANRADASIGNKPSLSSQDLSAIISLIRCRTDALAASREQVSAAV